MDYECHIDEDLFKMYLERMTVWKPEEEEHITNEKKAEELEADRKKQKCSKVNNSRPKASTRSRSRRIDSF